MSEKRLYLIDGNSILYRSYYAIQKLSNSRGFPTNAIFGFISTLRKIIGQEHPDYLGIVFDVKGPTVRHDVFKDYKAHRKPMPEDLIIQVPVLKEILRAMRIPLFEQEKYEADDVLASLAIKAGTAGVPTVIVTTDKDLLQVVDATTSIYNPAKDILIQADGVKDYFGVEASQVADVLALWGDPTDNIPGVPGVGEKTSKSLIQEFGSLRNLLAHLDRVKNPRLREKIEQNRERLDLSSRLVAVERCLPVVFDLQDFTPKEPERAEVERLFQDLEFTSLLADFIKSSKAEELRFRSVEEEEDLRGLIARMTKARSFALDTETDSPQPTRARLVGMSFAVEPGEAFYLPLRHDRHAASKQIPVERALALLRKVLEDPEIKKTGQNIKYDAIVLKREGITLRGIELDTMVLSYLLEPNWGKHNLDRLALHYLRRNKIPYESVAGKGKSQVTLDKVSVDKVTPYACQDADLALELGGLLWDGVRKEGLDGLYRDVERPLIELLAEMEIWGVRVNPLVLRELSEEFEKELRALEKKIYELAGQEFNINSPCQLAEVLFHKLGLPAARKTKITKGFSTSLDVLAELAPLHPLAGHVLDYRQIAKLKSTYADALPLLINPETGRIHTCYNQTVAATGRLSSSEPNLQNIPVRGKWGPRFRKAFIPDKGHLFLSADYSQIELRLLAHLSEDPALMEIFLKDRDVHEETAKRVFGEFSSLSREEMRHRAKIINFSIIYGTSAFSLAKELGTPTGEAQRTIDRYFDEHPRVRDYLDGIVEDAREKGYVETLFGRKRQVPELRQADKMTREAGRRIALNTPIQGSAADLIKVAMLRIREDLGKRASKTRMILQVHDELLFEVPEEDRRAVEDLVRRRMEQACDLRVPLKVRAGWGGSWADVK